MADLYIGQVSNLWGQATSLGLNAPIIGPACPLGAFGFLSFDLSVKERFKTQEGPP